MQQLLTDFLRDLIRQVFGWSTAREGTLVLTRHAYQKMQAHQLDIPTRGMFRIRVKTGHKRGCPKT
jgi:hypothetical protein